MSQKNPSDATNKRNSELYNPTNIGSRKHAVFATHCRSARPLQQRAGLKYFSDSCLGIATLGPTVNSWMSLIFQKSGIAWLDPPVSDRASRVSL